MQNLEDIQHLNTLTIPHLFYTNILVQKHNKITFNKIIGPTFNFKITYIHHHSYLTSYRLLDDLKKL